MVVVVECLRICLRVCRPLVYTLSLAYFSLGIRFWRPFVVSVSLRISVAFVGALTIVVVGFRISFRLSISFPVVITSTISSIASTMMTFVVVAAIVMCICIRRCFRLRFGLSERRTEKSCSKKQDGW